jgi:hypothetical protein
MKTKSDETIKSLGAIALNLRRLYYPSQCQGAQEDFCMDRIVRGIRLD